MMNRELKVCSLLLGALVSASCVHQAAPPGQAQDEQSMLFQVAVKKGETLQNMGQQFAVPHSTIQRINGLSSAGELKPGQILYIPVSEKALKSPDLRGRSRLVTSSLPRPSANQADDIPKIAGERAALYAEYRELEWPIDGYVSSGFGPRHGRAHAGIDIMAKVGKKIHSAHSGQVEYAGWKHGYGWTVVVKQRTYKTLYAHCSKLYVSQNQWVKKGQQIAQVGASGNAEGVHLHFEYKTLANRSMDPMPHFVRQFAH